MVNNVTGSCPKVRVDPERLMQILLNLLSNAIRFTPNGVVTISAEIFSEDPSLVLMTVADTGSGMPAEVTVQFPPTQQHTKPE